MTYEQLTTVGLFGRSQRVKTQHVCTPPSSSLFSNGDMFQCNCGKLHVLTVNKTWSSND